MNREKVKISLQYTFSIGKKILRHVAFPILMAAQYQLINELALKPKGQIFLNLVSIFIEQNALFASEMGIYQLS